jgi:hypothetical protein
MLQPAATMSGGGQMKNWVAAAGMIGLLVGMPAAAQELRPDQVTFRELYKELVETNTTLSSGSCTLAAERMGARLKAAGYADSELTYFSAPEHPKEGGLVAVLPGTSKTAKPLFDTLRGSKPDSLPDTLKLERLQSLAGARRGRWAMPDLTSKGGSLHLN